MIWDIFKKDLLLDNKYKILKKIWQLLKENKKSWKENIAIEKKESKFEDVERFIKGFWLSITDFNS